MKKITDAGEHIGGAAKDVWGTRGLRWTDAEKMSDSEREKYVTRDNIWPKEKFEGGSEEERMLSFFRNSVRLSVFPKPKFGGEDFEKRYVENIRFLKEKAQSINSAGMIVPFYDEMIDDVVMKVSRGHLYTMTADYSGIVNGKKFIRYSNGLNVLKSDMDKAGYGLTEEEKIKREYALLKCSDRNVRFQRVGGHRPAVLYQYAGGIAYFYGDDTDLEGLVDDAEFFGVSDGTYILVNKPGHSYVTSGTEEHCRACLNDIVSERLAAREPKGKGYQTLTVHAKAKKPAKKTWVPPQLGELVRTGKNYRLGANISPEKLMRTFGLRAVEFGNYVPAPERQASMNMIYDGLMELSECLDIRPIDIGTLGSEELKALALTFGSRGKKGTYALFEALRFLINLNRPKDKSRSGSFIHEYGHALDFAMGRFFGISGFASENISALQRKEAYPKSMVRVMDAIFRKEDGSATDFQKNSAMFDSVYEKTGNGYWTSPCEMFARAFACYIFDREAALGIRDDFMNAHAEIHKLSDSVTAYPTGAERERINACFDDLFTELKELGMFHARPEKRETVTHESEHAEIAYGEDADGQFTFM